VLRLSTPPLAPKLTDDVTVYLVLNDFGPLGRAYVETDEANATERDVVSNISRGDYSKPIRVVAFNTAEGWSRDVTEDIAEALLERDASEGDLSESAETFVGRVLDTAT
jgi:hypothetical protein